MTTACTAPQAVGRCLRLFVAILAVGGAGAWIGCAKALAPVEQPQLDIGVPDGWTGGDLPVGQVGPAWWADFDDQGLVSAVEGALAHNYSLQAAVARLEQAAADARAAAGDLDPTVAADLTGSQRRQTFVGFPIPGREDEVLSTIASNAGVSLDVSWEIDLWDRLGAASRAALADLQNSAADLRAAQLSIAGQTSKAWFTAAEAQQQVALATQTVENFRASAAQVRDRFEVGIRPALDVRLALLNVSNAEAQLQQRRQQLDAAVRQLEVLMGRYAGGTVEPPARLPDLTPAVPGGLPADLVARRPDLVAAERELAAAVARAEIARRNLLPQITLTGSLGTAADGLRSLVDGDFHVWSVLGSVVAPLWQGGRLRAMIVRADAAGSEALADYANAALTAYAEVETALAADAALAARERHLGVSVEQARGAVRLAEERYRAGLEAYITVLDSQRSAVTAEAELIAARRARLENRIDLYLALGGGFEQLEAPVQIADPEGL